MGFLSDSLLDLAVAYIDDESTVLHINFTQEPATYAEASSTYSCGSRTPPVIGVPEDGDVSGRKVVIAAITDGTVSDTQTAGWWSLVSADELIAAGDLAATQAVTSGNTFTLTEFDIEIPDPA